MGTEAPSITIGTGFGTGLRLDGNQQLRGRQPVADQHGYTAGWTHGLYHKDHGRQHRRDQPRRYVRPSRPLKTWFRACDGGFRWPMEYRGVDAARQRHLHRDGCRNISRRHPRCSGQRHQRPGPCQRAARLAVNISATDSRSDASRQRPGVRAPCRVGPPAGGQLAPPSIPCRPLHLAPQQGFRDPDVRHTAGRHPGGARRGETGPDHHDRRTPSLGRIGSLLSGTADGLIKLSSVLPAGQTTASFFACWARMGKTDTQSRHPCHGAEDGSLVVKVGSHGPVRHGQQQQSTHQTYLASEQHSTDTPLVYLFKGERSISTWPVAPTTPNTLHSCTSTSIPTPERPSVGGPWPTATPMRFRGPPCRKIGPGHHGAGRPRGRSRTPATGKRSPASRGFTPPCSPPRNGDIFVSGTANVRRTGAIQVFGENAFGFEDLRATAQAISTITTIGREADGTRTGSATDWQGEMDPKKGAGDFRRATGGTRPQPLGCETASIGGNHGI